MVLGAIIYRWNSAERLRLIPFDQEAFDFYGFASDFRLADRDERWLSSNFRPFTHRGFPEVKS